jgi:soluble lytic murein transglycosylase-like protein
MDRVLCVILCLAVIVVAVYALNYCGETMLETPDVTDATTVTEPTVMVTEPSEPTVPETEPPATEHTEPPATEAPTEPEPTEPPVALYDVPLSEDLQLHIIEQAEAHGIDPAIILAMIYKESSYRADNVGDNGNSFGLMQIQPRWHSGRMERLGCDDLFDPFQNVTVGIDFLAEMLNRYDGNIEKALVAYNQGSYKGTVTKYAKAILAKADEIKN